MKNQWFLYALLALVVASCAPFQEEDITIDPLPGPPSFSVTPDPDNPNRIIVADQSSGTFDLVWEFPGGTPSTSTLRVDTILYTQAGNYEITLHTSAEGGGGTSSSTQVVNIENDIELECDDLLTLLTGGCAEEGKKWVFSNEAGAIAVGPDPYSAEWFSSPASGLVPEQYDDSYTFFFEGSIMLYENNELTVDPCAGFEALPYETDPNLAYTLIPGGGLSGEDRIQLPEGHFIGTRDSGPTYDIVEITEDRMVLHAPLFPCDGTTEGWFTFVLMKAP